VPDITTPAPPAPQADLDAFAALVRATGEVTLRWFRSPALDVEVKGDGTPVTAADKAAERFLREAIAADHPGDAVLGEEEDDTEGTTGRTWVIDPIDGTKAFTHGVPLYSTLVALDDEHGPLLAAIALPALGELVVAGRGLGCWSDGEPALVSGRDRLEGALVCTSGFGTWSPDLLARFHGAEDTLLRTWGDGFGFALVATGRAEVMLDPRAAHWDVAPMPLIISEAGGRFTDVTGRAGATHGSGVATNGALHDVVLSMIGGA
jgi:histidinol phosphatase-like enzyme (inositol monophosphatase family)